MMFLERRQAPTKKRLLELAALEGWELSLLVLEVHAEDKFIHCRFN